MQIPAVSCVNCSGRLHPEETAFTEMIAIQDFCFRFGSAAEAALLNRSEPVEFGFGPPGIDADSTSRHGRRSPA
jgi:hypothetical protein